MSGIDLREAALPPLSARPGIASSFVLPVASLFHRELIRFLRQPSRIVGSLGTPILFWILLSSGLGPALRLDPAGSNPTAYFLPGAIVLVVLFTSIFSNLSLIEDRREGFLQSVLVAPIPRLAIVMSKVLGSAALALIQGMLLLALAAAMGGIRIPSSSIAPAAGAVALLAIGLSALGFALAWKFDSVQSFHAIMNLLLMPMWLLSGAVFPIESSHRVLRVLAAVNPLTYGMTLLRQTIGGGAHSAAIVPSLLATTVFTFLACFAAARMIRMRPKSLYR